MFPAWSSPQSMVVNSKSPKITGTCLERWHNLTAKHTEEFSGAEDKKLLSSCQGVLEIFNPSAGRAPVLRMALDMLE